LNFFYGYRLNFPVIKKPRYEALSPDGDDPLSLSQSHRNSPQNSLEDDPYEFSDNYFVFKRGNNTININLNFEQELL
jgi:hypothetical protein